MSGLRGISFKQRVLILVYILYTRYHILSLSIWCSLEVGSPPRGSEMVSHHTPPGYPTHPDCPDTSLHPPQPTLRLTHLAFVQMAYLNDRWTQIFVFRNHRDFNRHHSQGRRPSKTLVTQNHLLLARLIFYSADVAFMSSDE